MDRPCAVALGDVGVEPESLGFIPPLQPEVVMNGGPRACGSPGKPAGPGTPDGT